MEGGAHEAYFKFCQKVAIFVQRLIQSAQLRSKATLSLVSPFSSQKNIHLMKKYLGFVAVVLLMALASCSEDNDENNNHGGNGGDFGGLDAGTFSFTVRGDTTFTVEGSATLIASLVDTGAVINFSNFDGNFAGAITVFTNDWAREQTLRHTDTVAGSQALGEFYGTFTLNNRDIFLGLSGELRIDGSSNNDELNAELVVLRATDITLNRQLEISGNMRATRFF